MLGGFGVLFGFFDGLVLGCVGWGFGRAVSTFLFLDGLLAGGGVSGDGLGRHCIARFVGGIC
jgi:hypothetical protein